MGQREGKLWRVFGASLSSADKSIHNVSTANSYAAISNATNATAFGTRCARRAPLLRQIVPLLKTPILYLAGGSDELVPHSHMISLYKKSTSSSKAALHVVPNGTHNDTWVRGGPKYWEAFRRFVEEVAGRGVGAGKGEDATGDGGAGRAGAMGVGIPIMPGNFAGIVKESVKKEL